MAKRSGRDSDPFIVYNYELDLAGTVVGYFMEVSGIGSENEVVEHKVVSKDGREGVQKIPGRLKWENIVLKRGITDTLDMWEWRDLVVDGKMKDARKSCSIRMYDRNYELAAQWDIVNAWPSKISGPSGKSDGNDVGVEELTLVHEGLKRVKV
ncbi:MAG TPA: phage tail protein [Roseiflexaceae bacterium]|nr:phage tail protein [Roseiflexaceae bacterium]